MVKVVAAVAQALDGPRPELTNGAEVGSTPAGLVELGWRSNSLARWCTLVSETSRNHLMETTLRTARNHCQRIE